MTLLLTDVRLDLLRELAGAAGSRRKVSLGVYGSLTGLNGDITLNVHGGARFALRIGGARLKFGEPRYSWKEMRAVYAVLHCFDRGARLIKCTKAGDRVRLLMWGASHPLSRQNSHTAVCPMVAMMLGLAPKTSAPSPAPQLGDLF